MAQIEIKHRFSDTVLFVHETTKERQASGLAIRDALEAATKDDAYLSGAYLRGAYLSDAYLRGAYLRDANLSGADLSGANLSGADLSGANLSDANLSGVDLSGAYLSGAYLSGANLRGANLSDANLRGADLSGANLSGADLSGAYLSGVDLSDAYLRGVDLSGAYLSGVYLSGANLRGAKWRYDITINRVPLQVAGLHWVVYILDQHMQVGCELHTLAEWAEFDDARIVQMDGKNALRFWRAHKIALLALAASDGRGVAAEAEQEAA